MMLKRSRRSILNAYTSNNTASNKMKQKQTEQKEKRNKSTVVAGDLKKKSQRKI